VKVTSYFYLTNESQVKIIVLNDADLLIVVDCLSH